MMPFKIYSTFVIEEKAGFNKMTPWLFIKDSIKMFVLSIVLVSFVMVPVILETINWAGSQMIIWLSTVTIGLVILLNILVPTLIIPLFYTYSDMEECKLKE